MMEPRDLTALNIYEEMEWVGVEGICNRCHQIYIIPVDYTAGECSCGGWVSLPTRMREAFTDARILKAHSEHCKMPYP